MKSDHSVNLGSVPQDAVNNRQDSIVQIKSKCNNISCGDKVFPSVKDLVKHFNKDHKLEYRECIFESCSVTFAANQESRFHFYKHLKSGQCNLKEHYKFEQVHAINISEN